MTQRYVSNELIHFVGRSAKPGDAQFDILLNILKSGVLCASWREEALSDEQRREIVRRIPAFFLNKPGDMQEGPIRGRIPGSLLAGTLVAGTGLCFCDIPVQDLETHMWKYSPFGVSFRKRFLADNGATPVFYVACDAIVGDAARRNVRCLRKAMDELGSDLRDMQMIRPSLDLGESRRGAHEVFHELDLRVLALVKGFDAAADMRDAANHYMEREWRMLRNLAFALTDVYRIVLPEAYAKRFREAFPNYVGQLTFAESVIET